jgi:hypothetical protein
VTAGLLTGPAVFGLRTRATPADRARAGALLTDLSLALDRPAQASGRLCLRPETDGVRALLKTVLGSGDVRIWVRRPGGDVSTAVEAAAPGLWCLFESLGENAEDPGADALPHGIEVAVFPAEATEAAATLPAPPPDLSALLCRKKPGVGLDRALIARLGAGPVAGIFDGRLPEARPVDGWGAVLPADGIQPRSHQTDAANPGVGVTGVRAAAYRGLWLVTRHAASTDLPAWQAETAETPVALTAPSSDLAGAQSLLRREIAALA